MTRFAQRTPHRLTTGLFAVWAIGLFVADSAAQPQVIEAQQLQQQANQAYQAGDYAEFAELLEKALELNPASYATRYNLACGYARTGRNDRALALLEELAAARVDFGMTGDPDLASLRELPRFKQLVARLEAAIVPVANSEHVFTIDRLGLMPEGIAIDPTDGRFFFGSMRTGEIFVATEAGQWSKFAALEHEGKLSAIGLEVDAKRGILWAIGTSFMMVEGFDPEAPVRTGVFGFDLATGEMKRKHMAAEARGFNDLTVAPSGEIYASGGPLSRIPAEGGELEPLQLEPPIAGTNGITITPDGKRLYVAVYPVGLAAIELPTREWRYLDEPENTPLIGIDGLYWHEGDLVAIQNGLQPWRLLRLKLNEGGDAVARAEVIEFANPALTATTGAIRNGEIYYVGQAPPPENVPSQFPGSLAPFVGKTVVMKASLR